MEFSKKKLEKEEKMIIGLSKFKFVSLNGQKELPIHSSFALIHSSIFKNYFYKDIKVAFLFHYSPVR